MPVKGVKQVQQNVTRLLADITGPITEKTMMEVLIDGASAAAQITPVKSSVLVNSQYKKITRIEGGYVGRVGYAANYAQYVNDAPGKLKGKPRPKEDGIDQGNYWDSNGEPDFLRKGFERDAIDQIRATIKRGYKL